MLLKEETRSVRYTFTTAKDRGRIKISSGRRYMVSFGAALKEATFLAVASSWMDHLLSQLPCEMPSQSQPTSGSISLSLMSADRLCRAETTLVGGAEGCRIPFRGWTCSS